MEGTGQICHFWFAKHKSGTKICISSFGGEKRLNVSPAVIPDTINAWMSERHPFLEYVLCHIPSSVRQQDAADSDPDRRCGGGRRVCCLRLNGEFRKVHTL